MDQARTASSVPQDIYKTKTEPAPNAATTVQHVMDQYQSAHRAMMASTCQATLACRVTSPSAKHAADQLQAAHRARLDS